MKEVLCLVLGGGRGTRLNPLTKDRSKPAVPFSGKYRLVDIPISNSLHSGFNHIYVLTQFNSESLNKHIARTYKLDDFSQGFVEIMAAEQSMESADWFQGSADAVRRCLKHFNYPGIKYVLVLSGDQLYKMDFGRLLTFHNEKKSQITIACNPVKPELIRNFGIMHVDLKSKIKGFVEKPQDEKQVSQMSLTGESGNFYLASMGIYLFNKDVLIEILSNNKKTDFGREVIPDSFAFKDTYAYVHNGYWRDIGTIKAFYQESLRFTESMPPLDLFDEQWQFFTRPRYLPPAKIDRCSIEKTIVGEGSILCSCRIKHSVIGLRSRIEKSSRIEDSIIMGADFYQSMDDISGDEKKGIPSIGIGQNCLIRGAIIDKNARIGRGSKIVNKNKKESFESESYTIKDGIVIIPKNTVIAPGTVI
ncbi:MAG: glucose-1-phosphate adenylyltransferase [Candidatus Omnitrophica bacterium]|nr:glucose-1-phosphate adenylyltransferase [Candidatus Omnitrophota bacterium]MDD5429361.1 glucose-1-phosphate adenylyltransferase [Candidatus Omnitrophota bacterium]